MIFRHVAVVPVPSCTLIEDDVAGDVDALCRRVVEAVRLTAGFVPEHHHGLASVIQLLQVWRGDLGVSPATKDTKEVYIWLLTMPRLVRSTPVHAPCE